MISLANLGHNIKIAYYNRSTNNCRCFSLLFVFGTFIVSALYAINKKRGLIGIIFICLESFSPIIFYYIYLVDKNNNYKKNPVKNK